MDGFGDDVGATSSECAAAADGAASAEIRPAEAATSTSEDRTSDQGSEDRAPCRDGGSSTGNSRCVRWDGRISSIGTATLRTRLQTRSQLLC